MIVPDVKNIAVMCHEMNRVYCQLLGDLSQPVWDDAPEWQRESAIKGVEFALAGDRKPSDSHESWTKEKVDTGWVYGPVKDPVAKTHPCLVHYDALPEAQKVKDRLFLAIVNVFKEPAA